MFMIKNVLTIIFLLQLLKLNEIQNKIPPRCYDTHVSITNNKFQVRFLTIILNKLI